MKKFEIKISRNREEIYEQEKLRSNSSKKYFPKTSHFIEIVLITITFFMKEVYVVTFTT